MSVPASSSTETRTLRTSDPGLPLIAAQAAIEFDKAAQGIEVDFRSAKRLSLFITTSLERPEGAQVEVKNFDISTVGIVGRALDESAWGPNTTVTDVVNRAWKIASSIDGNASSKEKSPYSELTRLRDFCVALGNSLIAYRESLREMRPGSHF